MYMFVKCFFLTAVLFALVACDGFVTSSSDSDDDEKYEYHFGSNTTYYFERVAVVINGEKSPDNGDGHYITITPKGIYESDHEGNSMGRGYLKKEDEYNGHSYYSGNAFLGADLEYAFNSDYSRLNIRYSNGVILIYKATKKSDSNDLLRSYATPTNNNGGISTFDLDHTSLNGVPARALVGGEYDDYNSSTNASKRRSYTKTYSRHDINRQADVEAKAYEEYKKNPSRLSGDYYRSQRKMTQHMQEHASGR